MNEHERRGIYDNSPALQEYFCRKSELSGGDFSGRRATVIGLDALLATGGDAAGPEACIRRMQGLSVLLEQILVDDDIAAEHRADAENSDDPVTSYMSREMGVIVDEDE